MSDHPAVPVPQEGWTQLLLEPWRTAAFHQLVIFSTASIIFLLSSLRSWAC